LRLLLAILLIALLAGACERKVRVKLKVKSADAGLVTRTSTESRP
jgi:hypothetical protein